MQIKTTITTIKCTAEELRQSNNLADAFTTSMRMAFNGPIHDGEEEEEEEDAEDE